MYLDNMHPEWHRARVTFNGKEVSKSTLFVACQNLQLGSYVDVLRDGATTMQMISGLHKQRKYGEVMIFFDAKPAASSEDDSNGCGGLSLSEHDMDW